MERLMNIKVKDSQVPEGEKVSLKKWPTRVGPVYKSKRKYKKLLKKQVTELSELQRLHYASNRYSLLLIFQSMDVPVKTAPSVT